MKVCQICQKEFTPRSNNQKYCSKECAKEAQRQYYIRNRDKIRDYKRRRWLKQKTKRDPIIKVCPICHKEFILTASNQRYCSKECSKKGSIEWQRKYRLEHKDEFREYKRQYYLKHKSEKKLLKVCPICHKEFLTTRGNKKYCCKECSKKGGYRKWRQKYYREHNGRKRYCTHKRDCFNCPEEDCIV